MEDLYVCHCIKQEEIFRLEIGLPLDNGLFYFTGQCHAYFILLLDILVHTEEEYSFRTGLLVQIIFNF